MQPQENIMLGAIAGDIIGSIYERHNTTRYDFELFTKQSTFTDDTVMTVAMMDHILSRDDLNDTIRKWYSRYPRRGYGPGFRAWIGGHAKGMSRGNGAAMRTSPWAWMPYPWEEMIENVERCARVTHDSPDGIAGANAVAMTIRQIRDGFGPKLMKMSMEGFAEGYERMSWPPKIKQPGGLARESVPVALAAAQNSTSFEDAIRKAVSAGGDSDTIASIAGAVAEAIYGRLPDDILYEIRDRLPSDLMNVVDAFYYNWVDPDIAYPRTLREGDESGSAPPSDPINRRGFAFGIIGGKRKGGF
jgi:ADP-ribosylglycohydrolase